MNVTGDSLYSEGDQLQLNCLSEGGPELEFTWILPSSTNDAINTDTLIIANVTTSDGGDYTCNVTNDAGSENYTITVYSELLYIDIYVCIRALIQK